MCAQYYMMGRVLKVSAAKDKIYTIPTYILPYDLNY